MIILCVTRSKLTAREGLESGSPIENASRVLTCERKTGLRRSFEGASVRKIRNSSLGIFVIISISRSQKRRWVGARVFLIAISNRQTDADNLGETEKES